MLPDRVSNPGPLTYESGALPIALRRPAQLLKAKFLKVLISTGIRQTALTNETVKLPEFLFILE